MTGRSQAIRLPKEYRVSGKSVHISRLGSAIVLTPKSGDRWAGLFAALDEFPRGFTVEREQHQPRAGLSELFERPEE
jgi:antitoxin VapB